MPRYTYFIITPGVDIDSYVAYPDGQEGSYIKFGDSRSDHEDTQGVRQAYLTHNPDIGIAAVMDSSVFENPNLGTTLKKFIKDDQGYDPVGTSEWFSVSAKDAWPLYKAMQPWHDRVLVADDLARLKAVIKKFLP